MRIPERLSSVRSVLPGNPWELTSRRVCEWRRFDSDCKELHRNRLGVCWRRETTFGWFWADCGVVFAVSLRSGKALEIGLFEPWWEETPGNLP